MAWLPILILQLFHLSHFLGTTFLHIRCLVQNNIYIQIHTLAQHEEMSPTPQ